MLPKPQRRLLFSGHWHQPLPGHESRWEPGSLGTSPWVLPLRIPVRHLTYYGDGASSEHVCSWVKCRLVCLTWWVQAPTAPSLPCIGFSVCSHKSRGGHDVPAGGCKVWGLHSCYELWVQKRSTNGWGSFFRLTFCLMERNSLSWKPVGKKEKKNKWKKEETLQKSTFSWSRQQHLLMFSLLFMSFQYNPAFNITKLPVRTWSKKIFSILSLEIWGKCSHCFITNNCFFFFFLGMPWHCSCRTQTGGWCSAGHLSCSLQPHPEQSKNSRNSLSPGWINIEPNCLGRKGICLKKVTKETSSRYNPQPE